MPGCQDSEHPSRKAGVTEWSYPMLQDGRCLLEESNLFFISLGRTEMTEAGPALHSAFRRRKQEAGRKDGEADFCADLSGKP